MRDIQRDIVSAVLWSKDGKLFLGKKHPKKGGVYADAWHIPGGGVDEGEDKETALIREIQEETGIDVGALSPRLVESGGKGSSEKTLKDTGEVVLCHMTFYVYEVQLEQDAQDVQVALEDDLEVFLWATTQELAGLKLTPPSVGLFTRMGLLNAQATRSTT